MSPPHGEIVASEEADGSHRAVVALPPQDMKIEALEFSKVQFFTLADGKHGAISGFDGLLPMGSSAASSSARANTLQFLSRGNARRSWFRVDGRLSGQSPIRK